MAVTTINNFGSLNQSTICPQCKHQTDASGRFCGECGAPAGKGKPALSQGGFAASFAKTQTFVAPHVANNAATSSSANTHHSTSTRSAPTFARVNKRKRISPELQAEMATTICSLARERMFLLFHCSVFLCVNLFGLSLAFTAYNGYIGDEVTKTIMAMTPMMFINTLALACLSPIKGTNREIARIKERLKFLKSKVEYANLF